MSYHHTYHTYVGQYNTNEDIGRPSGSSSLDSRSPAKIDVQLQNDVIRSSSNLQFCITKSRIPTANIPFAHVPFNPIQNTRITPATYVTTKLWHGTASVENTSMLNYVHPTKPFIISVGMGDYIQAPLPSPERSDISNDYTYDAASGNYIYNVKNPSCYIYNYQQYISYIAAIFGNWFTFKLIDGQIKMTKAVSDTFFVNYETTQMLPFLNWIDIGKSSAYQSAFEKAVLPEGHLYLLNYCGSTENEFDVSVESILPIVPLHAILVTSTDFPCKPSYMPINIPSLTGSSNTLPIIDIYYPHADSVESYNDYIYTDKPNIDDGHRMAITNIESQQIRNFRFNFFWVDKDNEMHPIYINDGDIISIEICFLSSN